jgi:hypothetical protein
MSESDVTQSTDEPFVCGDRDRRLREPTNAVLVTAPVSQTTLHALAASWEARADQVPSSSGALWLCARELREALCPKCKGSGWVDLPGGHDEGLCPECRSRELEWINELREPSDAAVMQACAAYIGRADWAFAPDALEKMDRMRTALRAARDA